MRGRTVGKYLRFVLTGVSLAGAAMAEPAGPEASSTGLLGFGEIERVTLDLETRAGFGLFTLDEPPRVVVDFPGVRAGGAPAPVEGFDLIEKLRFGARGAERGARLVVDLKAPARVVRVFAEALNDERPDGPARFVLELAPSTREEFAALAGWPENAAPAVAPPRPAAPEAGDLLIVVDPGHGGADPGAMSRGIAEKDITLAYARALVLALADKPGFAAALTRNGDDYLSLRGRVSLARGAGAAVFVSLHADALAAGDATGASVFVLSASASGREAEALARADDRGELLAGAPIDAEESDVAKVLLDFARRETDLRSRALGEAIVKRLRGVTPVLEGRALQSAGFRVLRAPDVPSVLIELGFMSSEGDRARLLSVDNMQAVVAAIADAVAIWAKSDARPPR